MTFLQWTDGAGDTVGLDLDVATLITYERAAEVTEHPVENGSPISDHVKTTNGTFSLEGIISNSPVRVPTTQMRGLQRATGNVEMRVAGETVRLALQRWSGPFDRKRDCNDLLVALVTGRFAVTLTTALEQLENLIVTRFKVDEDADSGNALKLTLDFKQLRIVGTARAAVPEVRRVQVRAQRGPVAVDDRSAAARLADGNSPVSREQQRARLERIQRNGAT